MSNRGFQVVKHRHIVFLSFNFRCTSIILELSHKEWRFLLSFLRMTKSNKYLHKDTQGYKGAVIDKRIIAFYKLKRELAFFEAFIKRLKPPMGGSDKKRSLLLLKNNTRNVKKTLLDRYIYINKKNVSIMMNRNEFLKFRKFCLTAPSKIKKQFK